MNEILARLPVGSLVLDLGCRKGSFSEAATLATVIRLDWEAPKLAGGARFVQADAARLPFADCSFAAIVSNHSLEHFADLAGALAEIRRVAAPGGFLFVAVPDASTLTDRLYRRLARGGGHVNAFTSAPETARLIEQATGLPHMATRVLCSSLSFLNRRNAPRPAPRLLLLLGGGTEWSLFLYAWLSRRVDRLFGLRTSVYGWAFYFGIPCTGHGPARQAWVNVCIRCGSGAASADLIRAGLVRSVFRCRVWRCGCGASNPFYDD